MEITWEYSEFSVKKHGAYHRNYRALWTFNYFMKCFRRGIIILSISFWIADLAPLPQIKIPKLQVRQARLG